MKTFGVWFLVFFLFPLDVFGYCYSGGTDGPYLVPKAAQRNLTYCEWYNQETCCTQSSTVVIDFSGGPCANIKQGCADQWALYLCRFCSPRYSDYLDTEYGKLMICSHFADKIYSSCKNSEILMADGTCKNVGKTWKNGKDFMENAFDNIYTSDIDCFSSGEQLLPWWIGLVFCSIAVLCIM